MTERNSYSGDDLTDDDEDEEELDPRVQDELEKLNVAANSINHLEAELDEARAVFRQTMAAATFHLNDQAQKLGKCIDKARPFYDVLREMRKAHFELQKATLQFEKAGNRHFSARSRVQEAEQRVFSCGEKRAFDMALQEMLNQATIEVNEAENQKKESWLAHQKMYKSYQEIAQKAKTMQSKLKKSIEKAKPYFAQKVSFDRHLWQLKLRVDSIQKGLSEAKVNYSKCLRSLEGISDDIHQKRKDKKMLGAMLANLQEREAGVGADSEDETSLDQSQLDLDLDCNSSLSEVGGIVVENLPDLPSITGKGEHQLPSGAKEPSGASTSAERAAVELGNMSLGSVSRGALERSVSGAESTESVDSNSQATLARSGSLKREVYGCEQDENEAEECSSSKELQKEGNGEIKEMPKKLDDKTACTTESDASEIVSDTPKVDSSSVQQDGNAESENSPEEIVVQEQTETKHIEREDSSVDTANEGAVEESQTLESEISVGINDTESQEDISDHVSSECELSKTTDDAAVEEKDEQTFSSSEVHTDSINTADQSEPHEVSAESTADKSLDNGEWI